MGWRRDKAIETTGSGSPGGCPAGSAPGGLAGIQAITIQDRFFQTYRREVDFIQRYVFPGGMLPSPQILKTLGERFGVPVIRERIFGQDYAKTLATWRSNFRAAWPNLIPLGFDDRFRRRDLLIGVFAIVGLALAFDVIDPYIGVDVVPPFETDVFSTVRDSVWLVPLALAVVVIAPIGEEVIFRGFLFRSWVRPGRWGVVAVALISFLWAALHLQQYSFAIVAQIFVIGLVLGWMRWRSGSTWLTIVLHVLVNFESTIETVLKVTWSAH